MPKSATKPRPAPTARAAASHAATAQAATARTAGRPPRAPGHARRQIVVDTSLLGEAMRLTGRGQSDTVNAALAQMTENAAILEGVGALFGAFPEHPDHHAPTANDDQGR